MLDWVLPFAQYYLYNLHPDKYSQLNQLNFAEIQQLTIVEVEKLFCYNVIKKLDCASKKRNECSSLLQGSILYATPSSDSHSMFMELSRLFFDGVPNIHLANFLHMITVMAESGSTDEQIELFILKSQNMAKLPEEECVWCPSSPPSLQHKRAEDEFLVESFTPGNINEQSYSKFIKMPTESSKAPLNWKASSDVAYNQS
ncbi:hypothetical protein RND81_10G078300 [Saponaria officinalis]|uniref:Uncharacterized protein n=1 Tax=Saponaria officinalis TaxID=3572 RepID=A0AAW1HZ83_SAPOF